MITLALRQLLRFVREYPREPLLGAVHEACQYGLYDLDRLERMILRRVTRDYFLLEQPSHPAHQSARKLDAGDVSLCRQPGVNRKQIRGFAELEFIAKAENIDPR